MEDNHNPTQPHDEDPGIDAAYPSEHDHETHPDSLVEPMSNGLEFEELEPWPTPVEGDEMLYEVRRTVKRFVALSNEAATAISLWIVHAYVYDIAEVSPILALVSPERRCGKTTLLTLLECLVAKPLMAANITAAALFRAVELASPTLLIDELDSQLHRAAELRNLLNAGHLHRGRVIRADGPGRTPRAYNVFCPKVVARIGALPSTLLDRSIVVRMQRRSSEGSELETLRFRRHFEELRPLRRKILRWTLDSRTSLDNGVDPEQPSELNDRAQDNWRQLFQIADLCDVVWADASRKAASDLAKQDESRPVGTLLLEDIRTIVTARHGTDRIPSNELVEHLVAFPDRPWADWTGKNGFSTYQLASLLRPYGVKPKVLWDGDMGRHKSSRGYEFQHFEAAFDSYLDPLPFWRGNLRPSLPRNEEAHFEVQVAKKVNDAIMKHAPRKPRGF